MEILLGNASSIVFNLYSEHFCFFNVACFELDFASSWREFGRVFY